MVFIAILPVNPGAAAVVPLAMLAAAAGQGVAIEVLGMDPVAWITIGKSEFSWTCWKKIIHDQSDSSDGVPLSYIFEHDKVKAVSTYDDHYIVENIWKETFKIYYVTLPSGEIAAHAE